MSPIAEKLLSEAYENYLKTGNMKFTYKCSNSDDFISAVEAARQLYEENLITSDLDFVMSRNVKKISLLNLDISFALTEKGFQKF